MDHTGQTGNRLLQALSAELFSKLEPHLERVALPVRKVLENRNRSIRTVYFIETGLASMVVAGGADQYVEVGIVGNEGMTGLPLLLHDDRSTNETYMQIAGAGWSIPADTLTRLCEENPSLHKFFLRYIPVMMCQTAFTAVANGRYTIDERLARWILMAADRLNNETISLTHEFFSLMLGTRRASVTLAMQMLEKARAIEAKRGHVKVVNRSKLEGLANGSYGIPELEYKRIMGFSHTDLG